MRESKLRIFKTNRVPNAYITKPYSKNSNLQPKPSERFSKANAAEEYNNLSNANGDKIKILGVNSNNYSLKKSARSSSTENQKAEVSIDPVTDTVTIRQGRKKERRIGDKKHSHMYIEKNLSYSPSVAGSLGKNSQTPSLLIRNNLRHIDKVAPYAYSNKSRNVYNSKYNILNSNHSASNRLNEEGYIEYSPYKKYIINKKDQQWKLDRKKRLANNFKPSSILSKNVGHKIKLPHLGNKGVGKFTGSVLRIY